jgi:mono/diheme cytochrome c family protein
MSKLATVTTTLFAVSPDRPDNVWRFRKPSAGSSGGNNTMPPFADAYSDQEIAAASGFRQVFMSSLA